MVSFIILLRYIIFILLLIWWMIFRLWEINKYVRLNFFCNFFIKLIIWVWMDILSVEMGLFVMISFGFKVSVLVMLICWCWLLENLWGYWLVNDGWRFIFESSFLIFLFCLCIVYMWCVLNGFFMMECSVFFGFKEVNGFWKIIWIFLWIFFCSFFFDRLDIFCFLKRIWFFVGLYSLIIVLLVVDFL